MANAVIIGENFAEEATLSGGSYQAEWPITNLQTRDFGVPARSVDATPDSTLIKVDLGRQEQVGGVIVGGINCSIDARFRVLASDFGDYSIIKYDTDWKYVPGFVVDPSLLPAGHPDILSGGELRRWLLDEFQKNAIEVIPESERENAFARYWRIEFDDPTNADGYLEYSYLMIGAGFSPTINYGSGNGLGLDMLTDVAPSLGGPESFWERGEGRNWQAGFKYLSQHEMYGSAFRMMVKARDSRPVFVVPDPDDVLNLQARSFFARFQKMSPIQLLSELVDKGAMNFDFKEWQ